MFAKTKMNQFLGPGITSDLFMATNKRDMDTVQCINQDLSSSVCSKNASYK